ncbi:MAG TPA: tripartite tricarboxylate transporter substrate binding protein [Burkholderiales bacterium]|nr:tripartite tricarboxylate transporter substrate binding protein [Burkholderiales bacterium]
MGRFGLYGCMVLLATGSAWAQQWPARPLRVVVPFTAGSATDAVGRIVSERLSMQVSQPVVVENRPGAGSTIGMTLAAKAEPDGYTLLVNSSSHTVTPTTYPAVAKDTAREFSGITPLAGLPNVLVIAPSRGLRSVKELVAAAKARPGTMTYASAGAGSATQLNAERFRLGAGFEGVHVPFKGTPEALTEILTGRVDFYFCPVISVLPLIRDGRLLALAVGSTKRATSLPDVPTTLEAGIPNSDYNFWVGMFVPSRVPRAIVTRLHEQVMRALETPDVRSRAAKLGAEDMRMAPADFDAYIRKEIAINAALVKAAAIQVN